MSTGETDTNPDMTAQVGVMLRRVRRGMAAVEGLPVEAEPAFLVTSGLLAVAAELRDIANELRTVTGILTAYDLVLGGRAAAEAKEAMDGAEADARADWVAEQAAAVGM